MTVRPLRTLPLSQPLSQPPPGCLGWWSPYSAIEAEETLRIHASITAQLAARSPCDVSEAWDAARLQPNPAILDMMAQFSDLDTSKFVPDDPIHLAVPEIDLDMALVEFAMNFVEEFQIEIPLRYHELTVGQVHALVQPTAPLAQKPRKGN